MRAFAVAMILVASACGGAKHERTCMDCGTAPMISPHETICEAGNDNLACPEGLVDGCAAGLTNRKVCVADSATAGAPCSEASDLACTEPAVDGCGDDFAPTHVCITRGTWK